MAESQEGFPKAVAAGLRDALTGNGGVGRREEEKKWERLRERSVCPLLAGVAPGVLVSFRS